MDAVRGCFDGTAHPGETGAGLICDFILGENAALDFII